MNYAFSAYERFAVLATLPEQEINLAQGALLIAQDEYPDLHLPDYMQRLDEWAERLRPGLAGLPDERAALRALNALLFEEVELRGNEADYYDPRNSFLNDVMERKLGIPITLAVIYMEVGWRVGLRLAGVGLPGHFVVRADTASGMVLVDPFNRGKFLDESEASLLVRRVIGQEVYLSSAHFHPVSKRTILTRMLNNLKSIYLKRDDFARAVRAVERLMLLVPNDTEQLRDRGLLLFAMRHFNQAQLDLERYLWLTSYQSHDKARIEDVLEQIRRKWLRMN